MKPNVELHIEELILNGFPPGDRYRIGEAIKRELMRLFAERGVPPSLARGGDVRRLDAGGLEIGQGFGADVAGQKIARSLYGGLGEPSSRTVN